MGLIDDSTPEEFFLETFTRGILGSTLHSFSPHNIFFPRFTNRKSKQIELPSEQSLIPLFNCLPNHLYSDNYPLINKIIFLLASKDYLHFDRFYGSSLSHIASRYLSSHSLREAIMDTELPEDVFLYILDLKTNELANYFDSKNTSKKTRQFIQEYKQNHLFQELDFDDLNREMETYFGINLNKVLPDWYDATDIPIYTVRNIQAHKLEPSEYPTYQVSFEIQNNGKSNGFISFNTSTTKLEDKWYTYHIPAGTSWKIKKIYHEKPLVLYIDLNLSQNLPSGIMQGSIDDIIRSTSHVSDGQFAMDTREFLPDPTEFIVDNEDPGFRLKSSEKKKISSLLNKEKEKIYTFASYSTRTPSKKLPSQWTFYVNPKYYYGNSIKSCVCKASGKGDSHVSWTTELPENGQYEIFIYAPPSFPSYKGLYEQYYSFTTQEGLKDITLKNDYHNSQWLSIGVYDLTAGENTITLSDKGEPDQLICADAVKWKLISK